MSNIISLKNLSKTYGSIDAVDNVSLTVKEGSITGFLGPNGAGKSTTISMLMGFITPTVGGVSIFGQNVSINSSDIRQQIGFLASDMVLDGTLTGAQQVEYFGKLRGGYDVEYVTSLVERLDCTMNKKINTLSRGNHQKIALLTALMHRPRLLILDEPTSGLDPLIQSEFNKIMLEHKNSGGTVFVSSHILSEIQGLCDRVVFIKNGKIIADTTVAELTQASAKSVRIASASKKIVSELTKLAGVKNLNQVGSNVAFNYLGKPNLLISLLAAHSITDVTIEPEDLEKVFMNYYERGSGESNV